jgi:hypothetical protein
MGKPGGRVNGSERVKITEDVRKYAAEQGISEEGAREKGLKEKSAEFTGKGAEVYAKAGIASQWTVQHN